MTAHEATATASGKVDAMLTSCCLVPVVDTLTRQTPTHAVAREPHGPACSRQYLYVCESIKESCEANDTACESTLPPNPPASDSDKLGWRR